MDNKQRKKILKGWIIICSIYISISTPLAFLLMKVIELKYTKIFWSFFAIMGLSALVAEFADMEPEHKKSKLIKAIEHTAFISFITLMIWFFFLM